jgi:hypothetical protein
MQSKHSEAIDRAYAGAFRNFSQKIVEEPDTRILFQDCRQTGDWTRNKGTTGRCP